MDMISLNIINSYSPQQFQTIDEGMIAYKGRHTVSLLFEIKLRIIIKNPIGLKMINFCGEKCVMKQAIFLKACKMTFWLIRIKYVFIIGKIVYTI